MRASLKVVIGFALCVALIFLSPILGVAAGAGFALGLLARLSIHLLKSSRRARIASLVLTGALLLAGLILLPSLARVRGHAIRTPIVLRVPYSGTATLRLDAAQWEIEDEISLSESEFKGAGDSSKLLAVPRTASDTRFEHLLNDLAQEGWQKAGLVDGRQRLIRTRSTPAPSRWYRARTVGPIPLSLDFRQDDIPAVLVPGADAKLELEVPKYTVAATYPASSQRVDLLQDNRERIGVPVGALAPREHEVRVALLSPLLRWQFGPALATLSAWSGLKWIVLLACTVFSEEIKKSLLVPLVTRLLRLIGLKSPSAEVNPKP